MTNGVTIYNVGTTTQKKVRPAVAVGVVTIGTVGENTLIRPATSFVRREAYEVGRVSESKLEQTAGTGKLFDFAAIRTTTPDCTRLVRTFSGTDYYARADELSTDPGHLNSESSALVAVLLNTLSHVTTPGSL